MSVMTRRTYKGPALPLNDREMFRMSWNCGEELSHGNRHRKYDAAADEPSQPPSKQKRVDAHTGGALGPRKVASTRLDCAMTRRLSLKECLEADVVLNSPLTVIRDGWPIPKPDLQLLGERQASAYVLINQEDDQDTVLVVMINDGTVHRYFFDGDDTWKRLHGSLATVMQNGYKMRAFDWGVEPTAHE